MEDFVMKFEIILKKKRMSKADFCKEYGFNYQALLNILTFLRGPFKTLNNFIKENEHLLKD